MYFCFFRFGINLIQLIVGKLNFVYVFYVKCSEFLSCILSEMLVENNIFFLLDGYYFIIMLKKFFFFSVR